MNRSQEINKKINSNQLDTYWIEKDLKRKTIRSSFVFILANGVLFIIRMGSTAILARLLVPEDFGLVAMVLVFLGYANLIKDAGFSFATIQSENISLDQVSFLFWINFALSVVCMIGIIAASPIISLIYREKRLILICVVMSVSFIFSGLSIQHESLLKRQMRFGTIALINIFSLLISVIVGIVLALKGLSFWSLVGMNISSPAITAVLVWYFCRWRPSLPKKSTNTKSIFKFGGNLTASNLLIYSVRNLDNLMIGSVCGASALGIYSKAYQLMMMPISQLNEPVSSVVIPALSRLQKESERFKNYYTKGISYITFISIPMIAFSFIAADKIIYLFLGPGWEESVTVFRILIPAGLIGTLNVATSWIFIPTGRSDKQLKSAFFGSVMTAICLFIGLNWGMIGVAVAFSCAEIIKRFPQLYYACYDSPINMFSLWKAIYKHLISSLASALLCIALMPYFFCDSNLIYLVILSIFFITVNLLIFISIPGSIDFFKELIGDLRLLLSNKDYRSN
jgi:O-antigen/teichoic acid export membrane protein